MDRLLLVLGVSLVAFTAHAQVGYAPVAPVQQVPQMAATDAYRYNYPTAPYQAAQPQVDYRMQQQQQQPAYAPGQPTAEEKNINLMEMSF